jgi:hypothetical protein
VKVIVYGFGQAAGNSVSPTQILNSRRHDAIKATEMRQQDRKSVV